MSMRLTAHWLLVSAIFAAVFAISIATISQTATNALVRTTDEVDSATRAADYEKSAKGKYRFTCYRIYLTAVSLSVSSRCRAVVASGESILGFILGGRGGTGEKLKREYC